MLNFLTPTTAEWVTVDDDPEVMVARDRLSEVHTKLAALEAEELRDIRLVTGKIVHATDEVIYEAQQRLSIVKGTQSRWYLPEAEAQRQVVKQLTPPYEQARAAAIERLSEAGLLKLKPLCQQLADVLHEARRLADEIETMCQEIGQAGAEKPWHPFPALLPNDIVDWQLEKAKERGLWS